MMRDGSIEAFEAAAVLMPGGVNSPARACRSVESTPTFVASARGPYIYDVDGNRYVDYVCAFGPMILGHGVRVVSEAIQKQAARGLSYGLPTVAETRLAQSIVDHVPGVERVRLVNSGTEATMSAVRAARGFTGRAAIVKFEGGYHGHADFLLVKAGSGAMTLGSPDSAGVTDGAAKDTLIAPYNDLEAVRQLFADRDGEIAAIIVEPVAGNMGVVPPEPGFLEGLREITQEAGAVLIFDEVMTGFRVALGGAQERYGVTPDLTCLGKIVGGGLPVGAYGGRADIMACVAPEGGVYQAGTNSGNPLSVVAGLATLDALADGSVHARLEETSAGLQASLEELIAEASVPACVQRVGSMLTVFFTEGPVCTMSDIPAAAPRRFGVFWRAMREAGVMLPPSQYEAWFVSACHDAAAIERTVKAARRGMAAVAAAL